MRKLIVLTAALVAAFLLPAVSLAQTQDAYGGLMSLSCANSTGVWKTTKISNQWYLCTPAGHAMWWQAAVGTDPAGNYTSKYGSYSTARQQTVNRVKSWGFNGLGPYTYTTMPWSTGMDGGAKLSTLFILTPAFYSTYRLDQVGLSEQITDLSTVTSGYYPNTNYNGMPDWSETTQISSAAQYMLNNSVIPLTNLDYLIAIAMEDSDYTGSWWGSVGSYPFDTQPSGRYWPYGPFLALVQSPTKWAEGGRPQHLYTDSTVHMKDSLKTFLQNKYGDISVLNSAWGSNYTTWGSTATNVTAEAFSTTNGTNYAYTHTLANGGAVVPHSIKVYSDGTFFAGDCYHPTKSDGCNPAGGTDSGGVWGPTATGGAVTYSTKSVTVGYNGTKVYLNRIICASGGSCQAYVADYDDSTLGVSVGGKVGASGSTCCNLTNETVTAKSSSTTPCDAANCYIYTTTNSANKNGTEMWTSGARVQLFGISVPTAGHVLTVSYQVNGWMSGGTGFLDEDGRPSHTWLGTDPYSTLSNANTTVRADLRAFLTYTATNYFSAMRNVINSTFTTAGKTPPMYVGPETFGTWTTVPQPEVLSAARTYTDFMMMGGDGSNGLTQPMLDYLATNYGKPIVNSTYIQANADSACTTTGVTSAYPTQAARGTAFYNTIRNLLGSTTSAGNLYMGNVWWAYEDGDGASTNCTNWGLVSHLDNAYDGHEDVSGSVACSSPINSYSCGGEAYTWAAGSNGDVITLVKAANALWLSGQNVTLSPTSYAFGNVLVGSTSSVLFSLSNGTGSSVTLTSFGTSGTGFSVGAGTGCTNGQTLASGQSCQIAVNFSPVAVTNYSGSISAVLSSGTVSQSVSGSGYVQLPTTVKGGNHKGGKVR